MFEELTTPEQIEVFLAERRRALPDVEWKALVHALADEMAGRADTPVAEIMQRIRVYKRATDQLELIDLPPEVPPTRAQARGWSVIDGGKSS